MLSDHRCRDMRAHGGDGTMSTDLAPRPALSAEAEQFRTMTDAEYADLLNGRVSLAQVLAPCAGCADPINHPHAFDCARATH